MNSRESQALDLYITGNYGEDQWRDNQCDACGKEASELECGHGILCLKCYAEVHGSAEAECEAL